MVAAANADVTWGAPTLTLPRKGGRGTELSGACKNFYGIANRSILPPPVMSMVA